MLADEFLGLGKNLCTTLVHPVNDEQIISSLVSDGDVVQSDKDFAEGEDVLQS